MNALAPGLWGIATLDRETLFLLYFLDFSNVKTCWNVQQAAFKAGIGRTMNSANTEGCKLLQNPTVQAAIRKTGEDLGLAWDQVQRRLNAMITTSISDVLWWDEEQVHLRPFEEIPEEVRWAIESITETQTPMGPKREIKLVSRLQAIKLRAQLERRLAPDRSMTFIQQNNFYSAIPVDIRGLPPETLEKLMS